jgi:hypothetical protein
MVDMSVPESLLPKIKELEEKICEGPTCNNIDKLKELHEKMCSRKRRRATYEEINTPTRPNLERLQHLNTLLASKEDPSI